MGSLKETWLQDQTIEPMKEWIENYYDENVKEGSVEWDEAVRSYYDYCDAIQSRDDEQQHKFELKELEWYMYTQSQLGKFDTQMKSVQELLNVKVSNEAMFSLHVMIHAHIVAAIESYLASTFIQKVTNSEELIRKFVESDPIFAERKFSIKEIFTKKESLKVEVAKHLKIIIFHDLPKVKPMFRDILDYNFGDIEWLVKAVRIRHHCAHRAGLDLNGNKVNLTIESIIDLMDQATYFIHDIENNIRY